MNLSRRHLLGASAAGLGATAFGVPFFQTGRGRKSGRRPKNVIFCVADGMAAATLSMADQFLRLRDGKPSYWRTLMQRGDVHRGLQDTRSLNSLVTDSAAASSAWGSGRHIWNGQLNEFPDGTKLRPIASLMAEKGVRVGLVTTTTITHATPSGFAINCDSRDNEPLIAERYLDSGVAVLMGGGAKFFEAASRKDGRDLYADFAKRGYAVAKTRDELMAAPKGERLLGIFSPSHVPFTVDRDNDPAIAAAVPTLAEMTKAALARLDGGKNGFLLQIEGGKVDHGAHANDLAAMVYDQIAFEEAVKAAIEFAEKDGETLVIVTTDHACGGPSLNGDGEEYIESTAGLMTLTNMRSSYAPLMALIGKSPTAATIQDAVRAKLGIGLTAPEAEAVVQAMAGKSPFALGGFHGWPGGTLAMVLGNHSKVTWTSGNHTSDHVIVTAFGPGSERVSGLQENIGFFDLMLATKGIRWSNPTMDFATAQRAMAKKESKTTFHHHEDACCDS